MKRLNLNKQAVNCLLNYDIKTVENYEDDVVISHVLNESGIKPIFLEPYIYRTKTLDRMEDVNTMRKCVELISS